MSFSALVEDLQDIIWAFSGDMRVPLTRFHKFLGFELECWGLIVGRCPRPSDIAGTYGMIGVKRLKETLETAYIESQRETLFEKGSSYTVRL